MKMNTSSCLPSGPIKGINLPLVLYATAKGSREGGSSAWQGGRKGPFLERKPRAGLIAGRGAGVFYPLALAMIMAAITLAE